MSHISRVKTELRELEFIMQALRDLEIDFVTEDFEHIPEIEDPIELLIRLPKSRHPIALVKGKDGSYSFEGEQSVIKMAKELDLTDKISQRYAYHFVKDRLLQQGFHLESESKGEEDEIHLTLRRNA